MADKFSTNKTINALKVIFEKHKNERVCVIGTMCCGKTACRNESAAIEKTLHDTEGRISFIETAGKQLFEERVSGNIPDTMLKKMLSD